MTDALNIHDWQQDDAREPVLRVGVVLDDDALSTVKLEIPHAEYELAAATGRAETHSAVRVEARLAGTGVAMRIGDEAERTSSTWRLAPVRSQPLRPGAGVLVRKVVAGRGFHWQKQVDQTFNGRLEVRPGQRGLVVVNELPLEQYLAGVITAEMSGNCPGEFLKAQCVAARSWLLAFSEPKHAAEPFDRCNDDCCQRYQGTGGLTSAALEAVSSTRGLALVDADGHVVDANYSKSCGGIVEAPEHIWDRPKPGLGALVDAPAGSLAHRFFPLTPDRLDEYLDGAWTVGSGIYCSPQVVSETQLAQYLGRVDETGGYFRWTVTYRRAELEALLRTQLTEACDLARLWDLNVVTRGLSGRAGEMALEFEDGTGLHHSLRVQGEYRIRKALHPRFLYSSAFAVRLERDAEGLPTTVTLRGAGWGHGAGLCQIGALGMALQGITRVQILEHYFPSAKLERVYP
ncbi:MAG: SpoIID/LytB domain-containing protein [Planctomycetota bacterium]